MAYSTSATQTRIRISGARVIDPANNIDTVTDVFIADGTIAAVGKAPDGFTGDHEIMARDRIVCPGLVDLSARLREPGQEHKATIASESRAAASSGITTLCCPPDTNPVIDTPAVAELIRLRAEAAGLARVVTLGALTRELQGEQLSEMAALQRAGCVGIEAQVCTRCGQHVDQEKKVGWPAAGDGGNRINVCFSGNADNAACRGHNGFRT